MSRQDLEQQKIEGQTKQVDIEGKTITNAIGYCHCKLHEGALNGWHIKRHKCRGKHCKWFELYPGVKLKTGYVNRRKNMEEKKMMMEYAELKAKYRLLRSLVELDTEEYDKTTFKVNKADILAMLDGKEPVKEEENGGVDKSTQGDYGESSLE